jgi:hypothetical protein
MKTFLLTLLLTAPYQSFADHDPIPCPNTIYYANGNFLKFGEQFYFPNGNFLKHGTNLYYGNGNFLKVGVNVYYQNGNFLQNGTNLYYANGNLLKHGDNLYYANGNFLRYGNNFYYENGNFARYGTTLYRENGTQTPFPVRLEEEISGFGWVNAYVEPNDEVITINFGQLISDQQGVTLRSQWNGQQFSEFHFRINSGHGGEWVFLDIDQNGTRCNLGTGEGGGPSRFVMQGRGVSLDVEVSATQDAERVRIILQDALDSL